MTASAASKQQDPPVSSAPASRFDVRRRMGGYAMSGLRLDHDVGLRPRALWLRCAEPKTPAPLARPVQLFRSGERGPDTNFSCGRSSRPALRWEVAWQPGQHGLGFGLPGDQQAMCGRALWSPAGARWSPTAVVRTRQAAAAEAPRRATAPRRPRPEAARSGRITRPGWEHLMAARPGPALPRPTAGRAHRPGWPSR